MEKCDLMKEIDKRSSSIKIYSRVARGISLNSLNERSQASHKRREEWSIQVKESSQQQDPRRVKHTSLRCNQEDQLKSGVEEEEERAPQEKGALFSW